jgi:tetratricopeptide (TPR) repeat protein
VTNLAVATFKLGDAFYAQGQYESARESYQKVLDEFSHVPDVLTSLEERSLYQILRASLELKDGPAADAALRDLLQKYPAGGDAAAGLLLAGESFSDFNSPPAARKVLQQFEAQFPNSPLKPEVEFALARTYENEGDWTEAVAHHEAWLKHFPGNALWPQVQFALGRANFQAGNEPVAFEVFTNFVAGFPTNELAPLAQWWVADHFFRAGEFVGAETNYEAIFQNPSPVWQTNALVYPARLRAGWAAMGRQGYKDAAAYFNVLVGDTNCPPELGVQARFAYGAAMMNEDSTDTNNPLANIQAATNVFSQIVAMYPTNQYGARAWGEIGDCDILLGDFDGATNAFTQALNLDAAETSVYSAAKIGFGVALEKKAKLAAGDDQKSLLQLALNNYLDLMREKDSDFWVKKAGLQAAGVAETLQDWATAITIYGRLKQDLPQLTGEMDKKIAAANAQLVLKKN